MSRGAQRWPRSTGRLTAPSPPFPLENKEMFKTLVKNYAFPKVWFTHCLFSQEHSSSCAQLPRITQLRKRCYIVHQAIGENHTFILTKQLSLSTAGRKRMVPTYLHCIIQLQHLQQCLPGKKIPDNCFMLGSQTETDAALGNQENNNSSGYWSDPGIDSLEKQLPGNTTHIRWLIQHMY